jgi:hypothetical protein
MTAQSDLLASIVNPQRPYPWEPSNPEAEAYFATAAEDLDDPRVEAAIAAGWQTFSAQLDAQWGEASTVAKAVTLALTAQFQERMPIDLLQAIATTATALIRSSESFLDQLVACANQVLPSWDRDDLAVLARPLAYSLRDGHSEILDLNLRATPPTDWHNLSDIEKARLSLAIASIALKTAIVEEP